MSTTGRHDANAAADVAGRLREAEFVRLVAAADGDSLAASGVLARALAERDCPFQASVAAVATDAERDTDADCTVAVGREDPTADASIPGAGTPASETATAVVRELDGDPPLALALAGATADGRVEATDVAEQAREAGLERRPGVAVPTADLCDGLAHSTLVHAPFSGDHAAAGAALDALDLSVDRDWTAGVADAGTGLGDEDRRTVASMVALRTVGHEDAPPRAGEAVERALRPVAGGPFETIEGYADLIDVLAREAPGTGVALALGHDVEEAALDAWRAHARRAHVELERATTGRYDGLFVARTESPDAPVGTAARLLHAYRSPEPVSLAITDGAAVAVADESLGGSMADAAAAVGGVGEATGTSGRARFDVDTAEFITAFREAR